MYNMFPVWHLKLSMFKLYLTEYHLMTTVKTWFAAKEDCINNGMQLVTIHSQAEQDEVWNLIPATFTE